MNTNANPAGNAAAWRDLYDRREKWFNTPNARGWFDPDYRNKNPERSESRIQYLIEYDNKDLAKAEKRFKDAKVLVEESWSNVRSGFGFGPMRGKVSKNTNWNNIELPRAQSTWWSNNTQKRIQNRKNQAQTPSRGWFRGGKKGNRRRTRRNRK